MVGVGTMNCLPSELQDASPKGMSSVSQRESSFPRCFQGCQHPASVDRGPKISARTEADIVKGFVGRLELIAQSSANGLPLFVHTSDHSGDRRSHSLLIEIEVAPRVLDPAGVHQDSSRVNDRIHGTQTACEDVGITDNSGKQAIEPFLNHVCTFRGKHSNSQTCNHSPDRGLIGRGLAADVGSRIDFSQRGNSRARPVKRVAPGQ